MNQILKPKLSNPSNKITGRKVEGSIKPKLVINENRVQSESDQINFMMMSKINPSNDITPNKIKKKKKKKTKKILKVKTEAKEILKSGMKHSQKRSITQVFPWGVNQQRLRNYIVAEQEKYYNAIQRKNTRTTVDIKERRQQLGTSFLNQLCNKNIKLLAKKKKSIHEDNQPKKRSISISNPQQIKYWLNKPKNLNFQMNKMKMSSIHYSSPAQKFQRRNRSLSQGQTRKPPPYKNRIRTASLHEKTGTLHDHFQQKLSQKKNQNQKKVLVQYQNEYQKKITEIGIDSSRNQSMRKPHSQIQNHMSNSSSNKFPNESDPEQNIQDLDDSFYSQKVKLETQQEDEIFERRQSIYQCELNDLQLSNYNYFKKELSQKKDSCDLRLENLAALLIQKIWRGYRTRKMFKKNQKKYFPHSQNPVMNLNSLTKSQINKLIKFGYLKRNSNEIQQGNLDESSFMSHSRPLSQNDQQKDQKQQKEGNQYKKYMENFSDESNLLPSIKQENNNKNNPNFGEKLKLASEVTPEKFKNLSANSDEQYLTQFQQKSRKVSQLSIDVEEQEEENKVDIGEIRCAFGSESLVKSLSQEGEQSFIVDKGEQSTFQDFVMNKFKELMQRDKMDQLIALREDALKQRQQQTISQIDKALQTNKISPRTFELQQKKIEKWVTKQKKELEQKKKDIIKGQQSAFEAILKTQRDMQYVRQILQQQNSQTFIQLIDSLSQESANYSENSLKNSVIDIQNQNNCLSSVMSEGQTKIQEEKTNLFQKKNNNILEEKELICPDTINLKKLAQSYVVRQIEQVKEPSKISEKSADSYSILISNMLIQDEVNNFYIEMQGYGIDLYEVLSKSQRRPQFMPKEPKIQGMKTNSLSIKTYLKNLEDFILDNAMMQIQRVINFPLGPSSKLLLKFLQPIHDSQESDFESGPQHPIILSAELFGKFERHLIDTHIINHQNKLIVDLEHIHNKAIYDSLNEALDQFRPYGLNGQPFLWKPDPQRLKARQNQLIQIPEIIRKASEKVVDWSHYMAGIIFDKEDSPFPKAIQIDSETKAQIREDRLYRMLTLDILDSDEKWTNYDEETTEVSIDLADILFDYLVEEMANELKRQQ